jgi:P-aminobenzoate N-oxygenase AurF
MNTTPDRSASKASPLAHWDQRAAVRTKTRATSLGNDNSFQYFKTSLIPALNHPRGQPLTPETKSDVQKLRLLRYLHYTEHLEVDIVNPALLAILKRDVSRDTRCDAYKIYTDEGYHALMSAEMRFLVADSLHCQAPDLPYPTGLATVLREVEELPPDLRELGLIVAAALNETLISSNLAQAADRTLVPAIREMLEDHAKDEAVHHAFFSNLFQQLWSQITPFERRILAPKILTFLRALLSPDHRAMVSDLVCVGLSEPEALDIVTGSCSATPTDSDLSTAARGTLAMLRNANVFGELDVVRALCNPSLNVTP